MFYFLL